jgi:hypothetical protein
MATVVNTPADVVNIALRRLGYQLRVADLEDGSDASLFVLDIYGHTRDDLLRELAPDFAQRQTAGDLLKSAPTGGYSVGTPWSSGTYPQFPWKYEYAYPNKCLAVRSVRPPPGALFEPEPTATLFTVANSRDAEVDQDTYRCILTNVADAIIVCTFQVLPPDEWPPDFTDALAARLADRLKLQLTNPQLASILMGEDAGEAVKASKEEG